MRISISKNKQNLYFFIKKLYIKNTNVLFLIFLPVINNLIKLPGKCNFVNII